MRLRRFGGRILFGERDDLADAHAEAIVEDEHFTAGDELIVDEHVHGVAGEFIKFDDASLAAAVRFNGGSAINIDLQFQVYGVGLSST